jgi:hypothetical protein
MPAVAVPESGPKHSAFIAAHVEPSLRDLLFRTALANERSVSAEIRLALKRQLGVAEPRR